MALERDDSFEEDHELGLGQPQEAQRCATPLLAGPGRRFESIEDSRQRALSGQSCQSLQKGLAFSLGMASVFLLLVILLGSRSPLDSQALQPHNLPGQPAGQVAALWANMCPTENQEVVDLRALSWPRVLTAKVPRITEVLFINSDTQLRRRVFMQEQLHQLQRSWRTEGLELTFRRIRGVGEKEFKENPEYAAWRAKGFSKAMDSDKQTWVDASKLYSHYQAIEAFIPRENELVLIVEDDVDIKRSLPLMWADLWPYIPTEWDIIRVGWQGDRQNCSQVINSYIDRAFYSFSPSCEKEPAKCWYCGAQGYIVNPKSKSKILERLQRSRLATVDIMLGAETPPGEDTTKVPPLHSFVSWPLLVSSTKGDLPGDELKTTPEQDAEEELEKMVSIVARDASQASTMEDRVKDLRKRLEQKEEELQRAKQELLTLQDPSSPRAVELKSKIEDCKRIIEEVLEDFKKGHLSVELVPVIESAPSPKTPDVDAPKTLISSLFGKQLDDVNSLPTVTTTTSTQTTETTTSTTDSTVTTTLPTVAAVGAHDLIHHLFGSQIDTQRWPKTTTTTVSSTSWTSRETTAHQTATSATTPKDIASDLTVANTQPKTLIGSLFGNRSSGMERLPPAH